MCIVSKAIVLVAFGSASLQGVRDSIELLEYDLRERFNNEYTIFKSFTSKKIISLLKERSNYVIPYLSELLFNLANDGYEEVNIVPLHMMKGKGYQGLIDIKNEYSYSFKKIRLLDTLLGNEEDNQEKTIKDMVIAMDENMEDGKILLSGHGSKEDSNSIYSKIEDEFNKKYEGKFYMATLEGNNTFDEALMKIKRDNVKKLTIKPLLIIPGKHYIHDISEGENSYLGMLKANGINAVISKSSLLQYKKIRELYINNILEAIKNK